MDDAGAAPVLRLLAFPAALFGCSELGGNLLSGPLPADIICNLRSLVHLKVGTGVACAEGTGGRWAAWAAPCARFRVVQTACHHVWGSGNEQVADALAVSPPCAAADYQPVHWNAAATVGSMHGACPHLPAVRWVNWRRLRLCSRPNF